MIESRWIKFYRRALDAKMRLICFPYAGGSAQIFRNWADKLPSNIEVCPVQLPGRGDRLREEPFKHITPLVEKIAQELSTFLKEPFALFGHSLGAIISFELAVKLRREGHRPPARLFVSGRRSPFIQDKDQITYNLPTGEFVEELKRLNGTPKEILDNDELMQVMLPALRADFEMSQTYKSDADRQVDCPITVFGGLEDPETP